MLIHLANWLLLEWACLTLLIDELRDSVERLDIFGSLRLDNVGFDQAVFLIAKQATYGPIKNAGRFSAYLLWQVGVLCLHLISERDLFNPSLHSGVAAVELRFL